MDVAVLLWVCISTEKINEQAQFFYILFKNRFSLLLFISMFLINLPEFGYIFGQEHVYT